MNIRKLMAGTFLLCSFSIPATAGIITLNAVDSGQVNSSRQVDIFNFPPGLLLGASHTEGLSNLGFAVDVCGPLCNVEYGAIGYLIFDVSGLSAEVLSASIDITGAFAWPGIVSIEAIDPLFLGDVLSAPTGSLTEPELDSLVLAIDSGDPLGSVFNPFGTDPLEITLNAAGQEFINDATGLIGFQITFFDGGEGNFSTVNTLPTLNITTQMSEVPVPGSLGLFSLGCLLLAARLIRRKRL